MSPKSTDLSRLLTNPLVESGRPGNFLRLVLSEAAGWGMPGSVVMILDDLAALLGLYSPLPKGPAEYVAGPFTMWRTSPAQPSFERISEVEALATRQRSLIAFGGGRPGETVGTAEICIAMGNILANTSPPLYYEVFQWASLDVLQILTGDSVEKILSDPGKKGWRDIPDNEVLKPGGRLYQVYTEIATCIRRDAIKNLKADANPRIHMLPFARQFLEANKQVRAKAIEDGNVELLSFLDKSDTTIRIMFPTLAEEHIEPERVA
jgi:hypothetical protein